jgi:kynureninase
MPDVNLYQKSYEFAVSQDANDPLALYKTFFFTPDSNQIYLDGNSLGKLPLKTISLSKELVENQWGKQLIRSWNENWIDLPTVIGSKISKLVGANPDEIIVSDSTSVNLFKLVVASLKNIPGRKNIVTDDLNFPSDLYILEGVRDLLADNHQVQLVRIHLDEDDPEEKIIRAIDENTALVVLTHVAFKSGYRYDMQRITGAAHHKGATVLWDLSHSAGAVEIKLNHCQVDMAVGCTYKYLNGGPGAPAFLFVRKSLQDKVHSPVWGWFGDKQPFNFNLNYQSADSIQKFLCGTPPILSMSLILPGVEMILEAGIKSIENKSKKLSEFFLELFDQELAPLGFLLGSPRDPGSRGSHISIRHPQARAICQILIERYYNIPDFRSPDNIRLGFAPLYVSFMDILNTVNNIKSIILNEEHINFKIENNKVT